MLSAVAALVCGALSFAACKKTRTTVPPLCAFDALSEDERMNQTLGPEVWIGVASPSVDLEAQIRRGDLKSACGQVHAAAIEEFNCPGFELAVERVEGDIVELDDLIINQAGEDRTLLWAATDELVNGEVEGVAAMTLWTKDALEVHAVGPLRAYRQGARMLLHKISGNPALVVQSDKCDEAGKCVAVAQVVPIINRRFSELPLWDETGACIGRAQFELDKRTERVLGNGVTRRFNLTRSIELIEGGIQLTDLIRMEDVRTDAPDSPPVPYRKLTSKRPLVLRGDRLELVDEDIWERALRDHGEVESSAPAAEAPTEAEIPAQKETD